ncbi:hypothetical protein [Photorhabdus akhurstii]|uniref:hypothetical protein n=1 Tax=Photorhabdus akhurstii TaxID=171438 RepID=UPI0037042139
MAENISVVSKVVDTVTDVIEKVVTPASRAGSTVERVGKMVDAKVDPEVIALQMTKNSSNENIYTEDDVKTCHKIYNDSKTKVVITAEQTRALINDQKEQEIPENGLPVSS